MLHRLEPLMIDACSTLLAAAGRSLSKRVQGCAPDTCLVCLCPLVPYHFPICHVCVLPEACRKGLTMYCVRCILPESGARGQSETLKSVSIRRKTSHLILCSIQRVNRLTARAVHHQLSERLA